MIANSGIRGMEMARFSLLSQGPSTRKATSSTSSTYSMRHVIYIFKFFLPGVMAEMMRKDSKQGTTLHR